MKKNWIVALLIAFAVSSDASATSTEENEWVKYAEQANGDVYFYDPSRVERIGALRRVWSGIQYKTSVMGASSFLSLLELDCFERTEKSLQSTFFTDKYWEKAAMKTDTTEKPKKKIAGASTMGPLVEIVCD